MSDPVWHEVRFTYAPSTAGDSSALALLAWAEANGFRVVDWCIWERADGSRLTTDPVPPPPPHGFPSPFREATQAMSEREATTVSDDAQRNEIVQALADSLRGLNGWSPGIHQRIANEQAKHMVEWVRMAEERARAAERDRIRKAIEPLRSPRPHVSAKPSQKRAWELADKPLRAALAALDAVWSGDAE